MCKPFFAPGNSTTVTLLRALACLNKLSGTLQIIAPSGDSIHRIELFGAKTNYTKLQSDEPLDNLSWVYTDLPILSQIDNGFYHTHRFDFTTPLPSSTTFIYARVLLINQFKSTDSNIDMHYSNIVEIEFDECVEPPVD
jgi:hypothetical protein